MIFSGRNRIIASVSDLKNRDIFLGIKDEK